MKCREMSTKKQTLPVSDEKHPFRRLWRDWLSPQRGLILTGIALMLIVAGTAAIYAKLIQMIIEGFEKDPAGMIWFGPLSVIAVAVVKSFALYGQLLIDSSVRYRLERDLKKAMFEKLVRSDLAQLQTEAPAALASRFSTDISSIGASIASISSALLATMTIIFAFGAMLSIDWSMTIAIAFIFFFAIHPVGVIGRKLRRYARHIQSKVAHMAAEVADSLGGIRMVKTYQLEDKLEASAAVVFDDLYATSQKSRKWSSRISPLVELLSGIAVALLLGLVAWRLSRGTTSIADFMGLLTALGLATGPARGIGRAYAVAQQGAGSLLRLFALFDAKSVIVDTPDAVECGRVTGTVTFRDVEFAYPNGGAALRGVSFDIPAGSRVALVGRSGAGKTTVFNLLPRLYDVSGGSISIDGTDIRKLKVAALRRQIALVTQETVLLSGSIADNIGFGQDGASRDQIVEAARMAAADEFIRALPQGYDTPLAVAGGNLSGGQRQRLSIARAILRDAPILLLDEPTSALDAESEDAIRTALKKLEVGRTTLIIAHRLATILDADSIIVMDQGRIVDQGSHRQLLERGGLYADLFALQFRDA